MDESAGMASVPGKWRNPTALSALFGARPRYLVRGAPALNLYIGREPAQFFLPEAARLGFYHEVLTGDDAFDGGTHAYVDDREWVALLKSSPAVRRRVLELLAFPGVRAVGCDPGGSVFAEWGFFYEEKDAGDLPQIADSLGAFAGELAAALAGRSKHALARFVWRRYLTLLPATLAILGYVAFLALPRRPFPDELAFLFNSTSVSVSISLAMLTLIVLRCLAEGSAYAHRIFFTNAIGLVPAYMAVTCALLTYSDYRAASARPPERLSALARFSEVRTWGPRSRAGLRYEMHLEVRFPESLMRSEWVAAQRPTLLRLSRAQHESLCLSPAVTIEYWRSTSGSIYIAQIRPPLPHEFTIPPPADIEAMKRQAMDPVFRERPDPYAR